MSEIMDSYKDMSMSELGSSLLQRKEERERSARKDSRKQQRIEQALGLLVAGQAVFKGAYKKREKELDNALAFELENNKYQAKQIEEISQIVQHLPTDFGDAKTTDEKTDAFFKAALRYGSAAAESLVKYHKKNGGVSRYQKFDHFRKNTEFDCIESFN